MGRAERPFLVRKQENWPNAELCVKTELTRESVVKQFSTSFVEDKFDVDDAIQTKAEFSYAIAVIYKIGG